MSSHPNRASTPALQPIVPGVWGLRNVFVNLYFVRDVQALAGPWVLVDAGLPGSASKILRAAQTIFDADTPPAAIMLTHGHFDHVGALSTLLATWPDVPVYAHPLELPYLTGRSSYPPPDPTVGGGAMAALSFLYPKKPIDLGEQVKPLPEDGTVPELPGWRWVATPGHTPGHVSFFRESDRTLLAGDAFVTVKAESSIATWQQRQEVHGPPAYFTPDWQQARSSVIALAYLNPAVAATGHGIPMRGQALHEQLERLSSQFDVLAVPAQGRYVPEPARADESGVVTVPPPVASPLPGILLGAGVAGLLTWLLLKQNKE